MEGLAVGCAALFVVCWAVVDVGVWRKWWDMDESPAFWLISAVADVFGVVAVVAAFTAV